MKKTIVFILLSFLCCSKVSAQFDIVYTFSPLTSVPPYYSGQPTAVALGYYWFDQAMRTYTTFKVDSFFNATHLCDTMKYVADAIYRLTDDNPISFFQWCDRNAVTPSDPYFPRCVPSTLRLHFWQRYGAIRADTGRDEFLLATDIIAHVKIYDTSSVSSSTMSMVHVVSVIQDEIKGKDVPNCPDDYMFSTKHNGKPTIQTSPPYSTADSGTCLTFQYAKQWAHVPVTDEFNISQFGDWIKPDSEYIVFLGFEPVGKDISKIQFTIKPLWGLFGFSGGMYQIHSGKVVDPYDDFGIGASSGLTVSEWKSRLRARINSLINP